ncbi:MAG: TraR/DksA family transcriptional regulator [Kiritimatiellae bacterium]|nr:TraR/DksA family transcriptional regulator [Kiritimatiellia bacterium]
MKKEKEAPVRPQPPKKPASKPMSPAEMRKFVMGIADEKKREAEAIDNRGEDEGAIKLKKRPSTRQAGEKTNTFPDADLAEFRALLEAERAKALSGVDAMKATGFNESGDRESDGGDGTNQTLRLQALGQMGSINTILHKIDEAMHRIDDGTYGICTACGQLIRKPRLLNQPFVTTCMECQNAMEKNKI